MLSITFIDGNKQYTFTTCIEFGLKIELTVFRLQMKDDRTFLILSSNTSHEKGSQRETNIILRLVLQREKYPENEFCA